jgi:hypothetical protein
MCRQSNSEHSVDRLATLIPERKLLCWHSYGTRQYLYLRTVQPRYPELIK